MGIKMRKWKVGNGNGKVGNGNYGKRHFQKSVFSQGRGLVETYFSESDQNHDFQEK